MRALVRGEKQMVAYLLIRFVDEGRQHVDAVCLLSLVQLFPDQCCKRREHVDVADELIRRSAGLHHAWPADDQRCVRTVVVELRFGKRQGHSVVGQEQHGGIVNIEDSRPLPGIEWQLTVDRAQAAVYGAVLPERGSPTATGPSGGGTIEALCVRHPDHADAIRRLAGRVQRGVRLTDGVASAEPAPPVPAPEGAPPPDLVDVRIDGLVVTDMRDEGEKLEVRVKAADAELADEDEPEVVAAIPAGRPVSMEREVFPQLVEVALTQTERLMTTLFRAPVFEATLLTVQMIIIESVDNLLSANPLFQCQIRRCSRHNEWAQ